MNRFFNRTYVRTQIVGYMLEEAVLLMGMAAAASSDISRQQLKFKNSRIDHEKACDNVRLDR